MDIDEASWIDQTKKLVEYRKEAQEFLARVGQRFDVAPHHAKSISRLWFEADQLDALICGLLEEINKGLLGGQAELDVTRGASRRPNLTEDALFYDCAWSLLWGEGKGLIVNFAIEPETGVFGMWVKALRAGEEERLSYPVDGNALKNALQDVFAAEAVADETGSQDS